MSPHITSAPKVTDSSKRDAVRKERNEGNISGDQLLKHSDRKREDENVRHLHREVLTAMNCIYHSADRWATDRGFLRVVGRGIQQLLRWVKGTDVTCDEHRLAIDVNDSGEAGPLGETLHGILLEELRSEEQTLIFLCVKLVWTGQRSIGWKLIQLVLSKQEGSLTLKKSS